MTYTKWKRRALDPQVVYDFIKWAGAPSIADMKEHFATDSDSVRRVCGKLMYKGYIIPAPHGRAICFLIPPGKRGAPNIKLIREKSPSARGELPPSRDGAPSEATGTVRKKRGKKREEYVPYHGGDVSQQPVKLPPNYRMKDGKLIVDMPRDEY